MGTTENSSSERTPQLLEEGAQQVSGPVARRYLTYQLQQALRPRN